MAEFLFVIHPVSQKNRIKSHQKVVYTPKFYQWKLQLILQKAFTHLHRENNKNGYGSLNMVTQIFF